MLRKLALCGAIALITAGCTPSVRESAWTPDLARAARGIMGTELIGTKGATKQDQDNIDDTVAGACSVGVYNPTECQRHEEAIQKYGPTP